jgi:hypothetical protein
VSCGTERHEYSGNRAFLCNSSCLPRLDFQTQPGFLGTALPLRPFRDCDPAINQ